MISTSPAAFLRNFYRDRTINWSVGTGDTGTATKIAGQTGFTLFIQRIEMYVEASAAQTYILRSEDDAIEVGRVAASTAVGTKVQYDWGDEGKALPEGQGLEAVISGAGNGLEVHVEAYLKQTSTLVPSQL